MLFARHSQNEHHSKIKLTFINTVPDMQHASHKIKAYFEGIAAGVRQGRKLLEEIRIKTGCKMTSSAWIRLWGV